jgi:hypothetical protein
MRLYVPSLFNEQWHVEAWTLLPGGQPLFALWKSLLSALYGPIR